MKTTKINLQELNSDIEKCKKVFNSCVNDTHLEKSYNYFGLLQVKYWRMFEHLNVFHLSYDRNFLLVKGVFKNMNNEFKQTSKQLKISNILKN
mgnify:CR=1 FL=1